MKVVMPFYQYKDTNKLDDPVIVGGMDKFMWAVWKYSGHNIIPFYFNESDRKSRTITTKLSAVIQKENPDVLFVNYDQNPLLGNIQKIFPDLPILWITHQCAGGIGRLNQTEMMIEFEKSGNGLLGMVSKWQFEGMNKLAKRTFHSDLKCSAGIIPPAFCLTDELVQEAEYDLCTIGRMNLSKDPYLAHKYAKEGNFTSVVHTNLSILTDRDLEYYEKNKNLYSSPQHETYIALPHAEVMNSLGKASAYLSTHPRESFGIVMLEAFSKGVPVIQKTLTDGTHSIDEIFPDEKYCGKLTGRSKLFGEHMKKFKAFSYDMRQELAGLTKEKHSLEKWRSRFSEMLEITVTSKRQLKQHSTLEGFL